MRTAALAIVVVGTAAVAIFMLDRRAAAPRENAPVVKRVVIADPPPPRFGPGKGEFDTYFTERDESGTSAELTRRLALQPAQLETMKAPDAATYDIAKQIFRIYVPDNYVADVPHGVIYYLGYKETSEIPPPWKQPLNEQHLIFISPKSIARPDWQQAAIALDALTNLKKQYAIDPKRVYLFEYPDRPALVGLQMGLGMADVGFAHINRLQHYRPVQVPESRNMYAPQLGTPPADLLEKSKSRPHAFVLQDSFFMKDGQPDRRPMLQAALKRDGFPHLLFINIADPEELHYPNFHGPWLGQVLTFLGNVK
jgi:hypothetical protein